MRPLIPVTTQSSDGIFYDENQITGAEGTIVDAAFMNNVQSAVRSVQSEIISILATAGMQPEASVNQLLTALDGRFAKVASPAFTGVPTSTTPDPWTNNAQLATTAFVHTATTGVIGASRNAAMTLTSASAIAAFTADELIVGDALGGQQYRLSGINLQLTLTTVGIGGMDFGSAPPSAWIGIYVIYNPATNNIGLLAQAEPSAGKFTEIYTGSHMPVGFAASALVSVWRTNASALLMPGAQRGRRIYTGRSGVFTTAAQQAASTDIFLSSAIPRNARHVTGDIQISSVSAGYSYTMSIAATSLGLGAISIASFGGTATQVPFSIPVINPQSVAYNCTSTGGILFIIWLNGYEV